MDWSAIVANLFATTVIVSAVGFILKKSFEKLLEARLQKIQEQHKAQITEGFRRQAEIFDTRFDTLKTAVSLVYRARNTARRILEEPELAFGLKKEKEPVRDPVHALRNYQGAIEEILFEERALLPNDSYEFLHEQKHRLHNFISIAEIVKQQTLRENGSIPEEVRERMEHAYKALDLGYQAFVESARFHLGLNEQGG